MIFALKNIITIYSLILSICVPIIKPSEKHSRDQSLQDARLDVVYKKLGFHIIKSCQTRVGPTIGGLISPFELDGLVEWLV